MSTFLFDFRLPSADNWSMQSAVTNPSTNPAPVTGPVIYIIHNNNTNHTYVGYAADANHRWKGRTEAFHCLGITNPYASEVRCASCIPHVIVGPGAIPLPHPYHGTNKPEHVLIRAVVKGVLGPTTVTNTVMATTPYVNAACTKVRIHIPTTWPTLLKDREDFVGVAY